MRTTLESELNEINMQKHMSIFTFTFDGEVVNHKLATKCTMNLIQIRNSWKIDFIC